VQSVSTRSNRYGKFVPGATDIPDHASSIALHAWRTIVGLPLTVEQRVWLLGALHESAGLRPLPQPVAAAIMRRGPVRSLRALRTIHGFGRRRQRALRRLLRAPELGVWLADRLQVLTDTAPAEVSGPVRLAHPFGPDAGFSPVVARILGKDGLFLHGTARPLPGFPFGGRIVDFTAAVRLQTPDDAVIIGGGYVGCEVALLWAQAGCQVTVLNNQPALLVGFPAAAVAAVRGRLDAAGVRLLLGAQAVGWRETGSGLAVLVDQSGAAREVSAAVVMVAVGLVYGAEPVPAIRPAPRR